MVRSSISFCWKCLKRCHWSTIPKIHFIRFLQHICQFVIFMYIMIVIIIGSACLLLYVPLKTNQVFFFFFGMVFPWEFPGHFVWRPHGVDLLLTPRNLPGFSGDCVCPETLPDWCSAGSTRYLVPPQGLPVAIKGVGILFGSKFPSKNVILNPGDEPASEGARSKVCPMKRRPFGSKHWKFLLFLKLWGVDLWF